MKSKSIVELAREWYLPEVPAMTQEQLAMQKLCGAIIQINELAQKEAGKGTERAWLAENILEVLE